MKVNEVHENAALSNIAIGYNLKGFIAEDIFPILPVKKESDIYYTWDKDMGFRYVDGLRADGTESKTLSYNVGKSTYTCEEYALKVRVTDRERDNADDVLKLESSKTKRVQRQLLLGQERRVASLLTTQGNYPASNRTQLSGAGQWNNASFAGDIELDIDTGKEAVRVGTGGDDPNFIIIPSAVSKVVKRDTAIRGLIKYTHADLLVDGDLPPMLWGLKVMIPKSVYTVSVEGNATQTYTDVWGKHVVLGFNPGAEGSIDTPAFGYIFRKQAPTVYQWYEDKVRATFIEVSMIQDEVMTSNVSGYLVEDCIA